MQPPGSSQCLASRHGHVPDLEGLYGIFTNHIMVEAGLVVTVFCLASFMRREVASTRFPSRTNSLKVAVSSHFELFSRLAKLPLLLEVLVGGRASQSLLGEFGLKVLLFLVSQHMG